MNSGFQFSVWVLVCGLAWGRAEAGAPETPHFQDVLRLIRTELPGVTEDELNRAMVSGLLEHFWPRVLLVTNTVPPTAATGAKDLIRRSGLHERAYGYVGIRTVAPGLADQIQTVLGELQTTQRLHGLVVDLREAGGTDYTAAARAADLFVPAAGRPLLRWGETEHRSSGGARAGVSAVVVLVNGRTTGAAEALAAALREAAPSLVLGSKTAGLAEAYRGFPLGDDLELRIATASVLAGEDRSLAGGVVPDLAAESSSPEWERRWLEDPHLVPTNAPAAAAVRPRNRMNEAELVRRREAGSAADSGPGAAAAAGPALQDPVLIRGLDLLKGLSVVRGPSGR